MCAGPHTFQHFMDWILGRMLERSSRGALFGSVKISDLDFADDAVVFVDTQPILLGALEVQNEESEPLGLRVSWVKTKIQAFNDILPVPVCGEDVEVSERFTYLGSDIRLSAGCEPEVNRRLGYAWCGGVWWWSKITKGKEKRYLKITALESHLFPRDKRSGLTTTKTYRHIYTDGPL